MYLFLGTSIGKRLPSWTKGKIVLLKTNYEGLLYLISARGKQKNEVAGTSCPYGYTVSY